MTKKEKKRTEYIKNRDKYLARSKKRRELKKEEIKKYLSDYYLRNKEKLLQYQKEYSTKNKEIVLEKKREYHRKNREILNNYKTISTHIRRAKKYNATGENFSLEQWEEKQKEYNYRCALCKLKKKLTVDHIISLSKGGSNSITNIQPLCLSCNSIKR